MKKTKARQTAAIEANVLILREALFSEKGKDKDVTQGIANAFMQYEITGQKYSISFAAALNEAEASWAFELTKSNMEDKYDASGYGWDDDDKEAELAEAGARFLLIRSAGWGELVGYVHFRFTVQGEVVDAMAGLPCVYVIDIQLEEAVQRAGLGRHLLVLLELIGRREKMTRVSLPVVLGDATSTAWISKSRGYAVDESFGEVGFDPAEEGFQVYSKVFTAVARPAAAPATAAPVAAVEVPVPVVDAAGAAAKEQEVGPGEQPADADWVVISPDEAAGAAAAEEEALACELSAVQLVGV